MIVSWNIRGLNKIGKLKEISSRLLQLQPNIGILIETRVKVNQASKVRVNMNLNCKWLDNDNNHPNGRLWIFWDDTKMDLKLVGTSSQHLHCSVHSVTGDFLFWLTAIYAHNQLD